MVKNRQMAIPAKNAFFEAPTRLIHVHLNFISAQRESAIYWQCFGLSSIGLLFFKCEYLNFAKNCILNWRFIKRPLLCLHSSASLLEKWAGNLKILLSYLQTMIYISVDIQFKDLKFDTHMKDIITPHPTVCVEINYDPPWVDGTPTLTEFWWRKS